MKSCLNLCIYLDSSREEQCYKFINQFYDMPNLFLIQNTY